MDREIKFRAWNGSKMLSQDEIAFSPGISTMAFRLSDMLALLAKDYKVMQFTGLTDKNGRDIYEKDFVAVLVSCEGKPYSLSPRLIKWNEDFAAWSLMDWQLNNMLHKTEGIEYGKVEYEVVGNFFENPELLKKYEQRFLYH